MFSERKDWPGIEAIKPVPIYEHNYSISMKAKMLEIAILREIELAKNAGLPIKDIFIWLDNGHIEVEVKQKVGGG